jgi:metal-sulfur cluster biosynthetic enzyme
MSDSAEQANSSLDRAVVVAEIWRALRQVEDPEIPVSLVDMGLIVAVDYDPADRTARLRITYTAMGCPAMEMIQDDIRGRLLADPRIAAVEIAVVWDPVWTRRRLSEQARATMRELGIAV